MSEQFKAALFRAIIAGIIASGSAFFAIVGAVGAQKAGIAAGAAFFGALAARGLGEGAYDTSRDRSGDRRPGDVGGVRRLRFPEDEKAT